MKRTLKLFAPYLAVGIFWCVFTNAWLAILAYHAQILFWSRRSFFGLRRMTRPRMILLALPAAIVGPLFYFLLPYMTRGVDLTSWLADHHLSRLTLLVMIPYFGLVHPLLEQLYWAPLRESTRAAHLMFAGYHMLVLYSILSVPWLVLCFVILIAASFLWQQVAKRTDSLVIPVLSHVLTDLGIVIVAWFMI
jgi:hypothetical protein